MKLWIAIEIDITDQDLDWGTSSITPTDNGVGGRLYDSDITLTYCGHEVVDCDYDKAEEYLFDRQWGGDKYAANG